MNAVFLRNRQPCIEHTYSRCSDEFCCSSAHICMMRVKCKCSVFKPAAEALYTHSPGCSWFWPRWGRPVRADTRRSPALCSNNTPPPHTCPDSDTTAPDYSAAWPRQDDPSPAPDTHTDRDEAKEHSRCQCLITFCCSVKTRQRSQRLSGALTFSRISRARLHSGSASLYLPLFPYSTARLLRVAATWNTRAKTSLTSWPRWPSHITNHNQHWSNETHVTLLLHPQNTS